MGLPAGVTANHGVILTVGMICNGDRMAVVEPLATESALLSMMTNCSDAVGSWHANGGLATFLQMISPDAQVVFIQGEGMVDGMIPFRADFALGSFPGSFAGAAMPNNCCGMILHYRDPADSGLNQTTHRMTAGKTFVPAVPQPEVVGAAISAGLQTAYVNYSNVIVNGVTSVIDGASKWYRCVAAAPRTNPPDPYRQVVRIGHSVVDGYICTQRRRLTPRL